MPLVFTNEMKIPSCILSKTFYYSLFGQWIFQNLHKSWKKDNADCTRCFTLFYKLLCSYRWSVEDCLILICVHWYAVWVYPISMIPVILILEPSDKHYNFCDLLFHFFFLNDYCNTPHLIFETHIYLKKRVCYSCSIVWYKRTIDCGMQFKDNICQQMPCIIWHCRNSDLFSFGNKGHYFFFHSHCYMIFKKMKRKCETQFSPHYLFVDPAASCCN